MDYTDGKRFKRALLGYKRSAVDEEIGQLLGQVDQMVMEQDNMRGQLNNLASEKAAIVSERDRLSGSVASMSAQVVQLEQNLQIAQATSENLRQTIEAGKSERNTLQATCDQLRVRDREYALREREFSELQNSVSSIMSVTKRATDRLFQRAVDNQEQVVKISGDAAKEVANIRADMSAVRIELNNAMDALQDRLDRMDATLTGAVHKLVAVKHDNGLQPGAGSTDINAEVERLLSMRAGEVDYAGGKGYSVPVLGPFSSKFLSDTAKVVNDGGVEVKKVNPSAFESTKGSISEANRLLEGAANPVVYDIPEEEPAAEEPEQMRIGFAHEDDSVEFETFESSDDAQEAENESAAIPLGAPYESTPSYREPVYFQNENPSVYAQGNAMYIGDTMRTISDAPSMQMGNASFIPYEQPEVRQTSRVQVGRRPKQPSKVRVYFKRNSR